MCAEDSQRHDTNLQSFNQMPTLLVYNAINIPSWSVAQFFTVSIIVTNLVNLIKEMNKKELVSLLPPKSYKCFIGSFWMLTMEVLCWAKAILSCIFSCFFEASPHRIWISPIIHFMFLSNNLHLYNMRVRKLEMKGYGILLEMGKGIRRQRGQSGRLSYQPASATETPVERQRLTSYTQSVSKRQIKYRKTKLLTINIMCRSYLPYACFIFKGIEFIMITFVI